MGKKLEQVKKYKYLGSWITEDGKCAEEVKNRIGQAKAEFWNNKEFLRSNLKLDLKLRLLRTYIFPIVSYASETWTYNSNIKNKINAFEMWCYRRILKIAWTDKITNEEICNRIDRKESLIHNIYKRKMRFAGHVIRDSSGELTSIILEGMVEGKRD